MWMAAMALVWQTAADGHIAEGRRLAAAQDFDAAERAFAEACRADARHPEACYLWGRMLYTQNRFEGALEALRKAPVVHWRAALTRAQCLEALNRPAEAEPAYMKALEARSTDRSAPVEPDPLLHFVQFLYRQGRFDEARKRLRTASAGHRELAAYHFHAGRLAAQAEEWEAARDALRRAVELRPDYREAHAALSKAYYRLGDAARGAEHAAKAR